MSEVTTGCAKVGWVVMVSRVFVIPTEGRNLLAAGTVALQATADSSTATPFRNDKKGETIRQAVGLREAVRWCLWGRQPALRLLETD